MAQPAVPASGAAIPLKADDALLNRIRCRISPRARRISLRVDVAEGCIVLVRPPRASDKLVAAFLSDQRVWIETHLAALPDREIITPGAHLTLFDRTRRLEAAPTARRGVWAENDAIFVSGGSDHFARRLRDFIKDEARRAFQDWARAFAVRLNVKVVRVSVRDTTTRWGSCTRDGKLSLSWRLALAPTHVAAYVVAHEVAHLKHMNHSPAFWRTVASLVPDIETPRAWLRQNGARLHRMI